MGMFMKMRCFIALFALVNCLEAHAGAYNQAITSGVQWLSTQQNSDGSWGSNQSIQPLYTSAAVRALSTAYLQQNAYYAGITWLENNDITNVDQTSRLTDALVSHGDDLSSAQTYLENAQNASNGWGLSANYLSSTYDTALALIALADLNASNAITNFSSITQPAINFLISSQLSGAGWSVYTATSTDPGTTALVLIALSNYTAQDPTLSTPISTTITCSVITCGMAALKASVTSTSPTAIQAMAMQAALANDDSVNSAAFLGLLTADQITKSGSTYGSWSGDVYSTALAIRALANAGNSSSLAVVVDIQDQGLRKAINLTLGHNAMDSITQGELLQLTSLNASGYGISNLAGLQNATNLTSLNLNNNNLNSIAGLSGLTQLSASAISWTGNPGNPGASGAVSVPALPPLAQLLLALGLLAIMTYFRRPSAA
jgi:squalene cyclase